MAGIEVTTPARATRPADLIGRVVENPHALGVLMVTPALLILAIFLAYPFGLGVWLGFINYLGDPNLARASLIAANIWRGIPFFAIGLLAGLQTVSTTLYEAAEIDGAGPWQKFWFVTWPLLLPLTVVVTVFSTIMTVGDFQLIWIITRGGPANATHLFGTLAYQRAIQGGFIGEGAAISAFVLPVLVGAVLVSFHYLRRE